MGATDGWARATVAAAFATPSAPKTPKLEADERSTLDLGSDSDDTNSPTPFSVPCLEVFCQDQNSLSLYTNSLNLYTNSSIRATLFLDLGALHLGNGLLAR